MDAPACPPMVLIIEADPHTAELYRRELSRDYAVLTSASENEASEILRTGKLNAVVLEPVGLGKWGWEILATIKSNPDTRAVPIILCSTADERRKGLEMGAAYFLVKPVLPSTLLNVLRKITQNQGEAI
jgi:DNA-binding response OmpR family regulator